MHEASQREKPSAQAIDPGSSFTARARAWIERLSKPLQGSTTPPPGPPLQFTGKRVVAVVYSSYPADPRPCRAAEALAQAGARVEVICLKQSEHEPFHECHNGVDVTRIPLKHRRGAKLSYLLQYGWFTFLAGGMLTARSLGRRYDLVHVHNMPDVLAFSALVPKLLGAKVVLDLHDPMPELMRAIFGFPEGSRWVGLLKRLETCSLAFADAVLTTNEAFRHLFVARGCPAEKIRVVLNSPDETIFRPREPSSQPPAGRDPATPFVLMYHGSLVERHGLDLAVMALGKVRASVPNAELRVYGRSTPFLEQVLALARDLGLAGAVRYFGPKGLAQVAEAIDACDVGLIPNRRSRFTELNLPTRIFEYLARGKPVIAPRTAGIRDYFGPTDLAFFELGDAEDLAARMAYAFQHPEEMAAVARRGWAVYQRHRWSRERGRFVGLVDGLLKASGRPMVDSPGSEPSFGSDAPDARPFLLRLAPWRKRREGAPAHSPPPSDGGHPQAQSGCSRGHEAHRR
jgi:glycosyltransferase involved in cell wall biosynthesis